MGCAQFGVHGFELAGRDGHPRWPGGLLLATRHLQVLSFELFRFGVGPAFCVRRLLQTALARERSLQAPRRVVLTAVLRQRTHLLGRAALLPG